MKKSETGGTERLRILAIGDSITYGAYMQDREAGVTGVVHPNYAEIVAELLGATEFENYSVSGTCITSVGGVEGLLDSSLAKRCGLVRDGDLVLVAMGTNDFGCGNPVGNRTDREDVSVYGALDLSFDTLKRNNPAAKIYVLLPIDRSDMTVNRNGNTLDDYRNAIRERAIEYGFFVIDGRKFPIDQSDPLQKETYIPDGVHPTPAGHLLLARMVYRAIAGENAPDIRVDGLCAAMKPGEENALTARVSGRGARGGVSWASSDERVATVKNGVVRALSAGRATITAKTSMGLTVPFVCVVAQRTEVSGGREPRKEVFRVNGYEATVLIPPAANGEWIWKTEFFYAFDRAERELYDAGYTRVYYGISDKYGSPESVKLMYGFYLELMRRYALAPKAILFGFSRGGLYAFNFALAHPECVGKVYLDAPVLDLRSWPRTDPSFEEVDLHDQVRKEYGFSDEKQFLEYREYPVERFQEYFAREIPTLLVAGDADRTVSFSKNAEKMIKYGEGNATGLVYYVKVGADHHPHSFGNACPGGIAPETVSVYSSELPSSSRERPQTVKNESALVVRFVQNGK